MPGPRTDWEELARRQPYFRILTHEGESRVESNDVATPRFWETGEADVSALLTTVSSVLGHEPPLTTVLDFGCGVGRLTLPLARRAKAVVACDIAPTMLDHVRRNAAAAGLGNITAVRDDELVTMVDGLFSFICSLLVFQYIPRSSGYETLRSLLRLLAPGGIAVVDLTVAPPGERLRQLARMAGGRSRRSVRAGLRNGPTEGVQTYAYDESVVLDAIAAANASVIGRHATHDGGTVLIIGKASA